MAYRDWPCGPGKCPECKKQFKSLQGHYRAEHQHSCRVKYPDGTVDRVFRDAAVGGFQCGGCANVFQVPRMLQDHVRKGCSPSQPPTTPKSSPGRIRIKKRAKAETVASDTETDAPTSDRRPKDSVKNQLPTKLKLVVPASPNKRRKLDRDGTKRESPAHPDDSLSQDNLGGDSRGDGQDKSLIAQVDGARGDSGLEIGQSNDSTIVHEEYPRASSPLRALATDSLEPPSMAPDELQEHEAAVSEQDVPTVPLDSRPETEPEETQATSSPASPQPEGETLESQPVQADDLTMDDPKLSAVEGDEHPQSPHMEVDDPSPSAASELEPELKLVAIHPESASASASEQLEARPMPSSASPESSPSPSESEPVQQDVPMGDVDGSSSTEGDQLVGDGSVSAEAQSGCMLPESQPSTLIPSGTHPNSPAASTSPEPPVAVLAPADPPAAPTLLESRSVSEPLEAPEPAPEPEDELMPLSEDDSQLVHSLEDEPQPIQSPESLQAVPLPEDCQPLPTPSGPFSPRLPFSSHSPCALSKPQPLPTSEESQPLQALSENDLGDTDMAVDLLGLDELELQYPEDDAMGVVLGAEVSMDEPQPQPVPADPDASPLPSPPRTANKDEESTSCVSRETSPADASPHPDIQAAMVVDSPEIPDSPTGGAPANNNLEVIEGEHRSGSDPPLKLMSQSLTGRLLSPSIRLMDRSLSPAEGSAYDKADPAHISPCEGESTGLRDAFSSMPVTVAGTVLREESEETDSEGSTSRSVSAEASSSSTRGEPLPPDHPVALFLDGICAGQSPPAHFAHAFVDLGYDTDELLDLLACAKPECGDWHGLEKEILVHKKYDAWWLRLKIALRERAKTCLQRCENS